MRAEPPKPIGASRYVVRFVADQTQRDQLEELRSLMRGSVPDGDMAAIIARAVGALLRKERTRIAGSSERRARPRSSSSTHGSRHIPASIRRTVWDRDEGRCAFESNSGERCSSREFIQFHHIVPFAKGGVHSVENLSLRCQAHNDYEAETEYGSMKMLQHRKRREDLELEP